MCVPFAQATARPAGGVAADGRDGATVLSHKFAK